MSNKTLLMETKSDLTDVEIDEFFNIFNSAVDRGELMNLTLSVSDNDAFNTQRTIKLSVRRIVRDK